MVPCLCDGCMYQSMSLLLWTMQQKPAIALVGLHSCVTWFIWHTDKDAFTNVVRLCMHVPIYTMSAAALGSFQLTVLTCHMFTGKHVVGEGISWHTLDVLSCLEKDTMWTQRALNKDCQNIRVCVFRLEYKTFHTDAYIKLFCLMLGSWTPQRR